MTGDRDAAEVGTEAVTDAWCSVVIPAHDEARVIGRCLDALTAAAGGRPIEVVVVPNGCRDDTAEVARATGLVGLRVVELTEPSKSAALNAGDAAASAFPRIYLDADVDLAADALEPLVAALDVNEPVVAAPAVHFDTSAASRPVRAYYEVYRQLPYASEGLTGLGLYGLSAAGRARFDWFPDLTADDLYSRVGFVLQDVHLLRETVHDNIALARPNLVKVRTRVARGNAELASAAESGAVGDVDASSSTRSTLAALGRLVVRQPRLAPGAFVYLGVVVAGRIRARRTAVTWDRDDSTR